MKAAIKHKSIRHIAIVLAVLAATAYVGFLFGYYRGAENTKLNYDYERCMQNPQHSLAMSDPPQCVDELGTHRYQYK